MPSDERLAVQEAHVQLPVDTTIQSPFNPLAARNAKKGKIRGVEELCTKDSSFQINAQILAIAETRTVHTPLLLILPNTLLSNLCDDIQRKVVPFAELRQRNVASVHEDLVHPLIEVISIEAGFYFRKKYVISFVR